MALFKRKKKEEIKPQAPIVQKEDLQEIKSAEIPLTVTEKEIVVPITVSEPQSPVTAITIPIEKVCGRCGKFYTIKRVKGYSTEYSCECGFNLCDMR